MNADMTNNTNNKLFDNSHSAGDFCIFRQIPNVLRARDFRLYMADNRRLVDLWLNGGAAVLGHTPPNLLRELKNTASRGLYAPFPHFSEGRYIKALVKLFPKSRFRLYAAPPPELVSFFNSGTAGLWYPFTGTSTTAQENSQASSFAADNTPLLIPVLPGIQTWRYNLPLGLCVAASNPICAESENLFAQLPASDNLSPILLAVATRGVYNLLASPERATPIVPHVMNVLQKSRWQRRGIYLTLKKEIKAEEWAALFYQFLEAGFLLPPIQSHPLILPGELSAGEEAKLAAVLL